MSEVRVILGHDEVNGYLSEHGLETGYVELDAILLQRDGTTSGRPCVLFVFLMPDGKRVLAKTTLRILSMAMGAIRNLRTPAPDEPLDVPGELNPNHQVTQALHNHWHRIAALLVAKHGRTMITLQDIEETVRSGRALAVVGHGDAGLELYMTDAADAERMARREGGLPE